jgi:hypothetical protein
LNEDPIQQVNVADKYPEKVKELEKLFWEEAEKYDVYPVGGSLGRALQPESNPQRAAKRHWELTPNVYRVPELAGPEIKSTNYEINAYITADERPRGLSMRWASTSEDRRCLSWMENCDTAIPPSACTGTISTAM